MKKDEILKAIRNGLRLGCYAFSKWSEGHAINEYGAEGILVTHICGQIGRSLNHEPGRYLTVEEPFWNIDAGTQKRGRKPKILSDGNRVDICLWNNENPVAVIEVKRKFDNRSCEKDIRRVEGLIDRYGRHSGGTLQFGCFAFPTIFMDVVAKDEFRDKKPVMENDAATYLKGQRKFYRDWIGEFAFKDGLIAKPYSMGDDIRAIEYQYDNAEWVALLGVSGVILDLESSRADKMDFNG